MLMMVLTLLVKRSSPLVVRGRGFTPSRALLSTRAEADGGSSEEQLVTLRLPKDFVVPAWWQTAEPAETARASHTASLRSRARLTGSSCCLAWSVSWGTWTKTAF